MLSEGDTHTEVEHDMVRMRYLREAMAPWFCQRQKALDKIEWLEQDRAPLARLNANGLLNSRFSGREVTNLLTLGVTLFQKDHEFRALYSRVACQDNSPKKHILAKAGFPPTALPPPHPLGNMAPGP